VDKDIRLVLPCGADSQLAVRTVHRVARLECDNLPPCELFEVRTELRGSVCQFRINTPTWDKNAAATHIEVGHSQSMLAPEWQRHFRRRRIPLLLYANTLLMDEQGHLHQRP
jgi:hypothetical protein